MNGFLAVLSRDIRLATRAGGGAFLAMAFFAAVATLVPLGVGSDLQLLARIAGGVLWVGAILAALLSLDRLFQPDFEDGSLDVLALSPMPLEALSFAKIVAHWITTGLALTILSPILGLLFGLPRQEYMPLVISLAIGTPAVSAIGAIATALTLSIRRGGLILPFIVLPLLAPVVIFGASAVTGAAEELPNGALGLLAAFSFAVTVISSFVTAAALRLNLAG